MPDDWAAHQRRHAIAQELAPSLVGLPTEEAVARAEARGLKTQVVRDVMTTELGLGRIRLVEDAGGVVTQAWAG